MGEGYRGGEGASEARLDALREEARTTGRVAAAGVRAAGSPLPPSGALAAGPGYYGHPVVKPPVWTWEVPLYLFVGGLAGMAAVIALAALVFRDSLMLVRWALWIAAVGGAVVSPLLLIKDLGRPTRFLYMLRLFKWRSPMSMGVWILVTFSLFAVGALAWLEGFHRLVDAGLSGTLLRGVLFLLAAGAAVTGTLLATYTGVLLGATAIPAWNVHHRLLPVHFGTAGLGSAAAALELADFALPALNALGLAAAAVETVLWLWLEARRHGAADRALREGRSGALIRAAGLLAGPAALVLRATGLTVYAALAFLLGALLSRYGWVAAGRASGRDPQATFAASGR